MKNWESVDSLFEHLNNTQNYLILRNYEDIKTQVTKDAHPDIDFLCQDAEAFIESIGSIKRTDRKVDIIHQKISIAGKSVDIDVRQVGDGYYCEKWERHMLDEKVLYDNMVYVMSEEDYHYSLMYHALVQKKKVSDDYRKKLEAWEHTAFDRYTYMNKLSDYMREKGYIYTFPSFNGGIFNVDGADKKLIEKSFSKKVGRALYPFKRKLGLE